ncbi:MAG: response regulator transcription factor [Ilumatobacter sp.]
MRILLIEDDDTIRRELADGLRLHEFDVDTRSDGRGGLLQAHDATYDAIVLDLLLPEMNGYEVLSELRAAGDATPVLILTAKTGEHDVADLLAAGADDFVSKPFRLVEVVARIDNIVRRVAGVGSELRHTTLRLDARSRRVDRSGVSIDLTPTEFRMLERLLRSSPAVVTRQDFLDEIWDPVHPPDDNIVQLYIGYLRRKIDAPFGTDTITTIRGVGYRVDAAS